MKKLLLFIVLMSCGKIFSQKAVVFKQENIGTDSIIYTEADKNPEYPGGIIAFQKSFSQAFDKNKVLETGHLSTEAQFVVSKEGNITEVITLGHNLTLNQEIKRAIYSIKEKWVPAEIKGKPVNFKFRLPVKMNIPES